MPNYPFLTGLNQLNIMVKRVLLLFLLLGLMQAQSVYAEEINFTYSGPGNFSASQALSGTVTIRHTEFIPENATLNAYIDGSLASALLMKDYVGKRGSYAFKPQPFSYNLTAYGINEYKIYPPQSFSYTIRAEGTCGGDYCCDEQGCWCD